MQAACSCGLSFLPSVARSRRFFLFVIVPAIVIAEQNLRLQRLIAKMTAAIRIAFYSGMRMDEIRRAERIADTFVLADTKNGEPELCQCTARFDAVQMWRCQIKVGYAFREQPS